MNTESILRFLRTVDHDFSPYLSDKTDLEDFAEKISKVSHYEYEMSDNGEIKGMVVGYANDRVRKFAYISMVAVHPQHRKQGVAKRLILAFIKYVSNIEYIKILGIHTNNPVALNLYKEVGFVIVSESNGRYYLEYSF